MCCVAEVSNTHLSVQPFTYKPTNLIPVSGFGSSSYKIYQSKFFELYRCCMGLGYKILDHPYSTETVYLSLGVAQEAGPHAGAPDCFAEGFLFCEE